MASDSRPSVLLTNDDGIEAVGLQTLYEQLSEFADVTVVAPRENHSGMGRVLSFGRPVPLRVGTETDSIEFEESQLGHNVQFESHDLGYAVEGTPCDCVIAGVTELSEPDIVASGCNPGANIGVNAFGRSGTVAAAIEAAYFGVPAVALSSENREPARSTYSQIGEFAKRLVRFSLSNGVFDRVDYLNVASPAGTDPPVEVTRPASEYQFTASVDESEGVLRFTHSRQPERVTGVDHGGENQTDREALKQGKVSITPLRFPFEPTDSPDLRSFTDATR